MNVPNTTIAPYKVGERKTPKFHACALELPTDKLDIVKACKLDLAYVLIKLYGMNDDDPWPGWSGLNTLLNADKIPMVSHIGYLLLVDAPTTEYSTLQEVL